jgi:4-methylaminobutanoate oxidase (formaldehyde-forming)
MHVLDSCRMEKGYRHWGHDIGCEDHVLEAGLGFAVRSGKPDGRFGPFIGRDAVLRLRDGGPKRRLLQFRLEDPEPLLFHNEPILRDGRIVGRLTSGAYGHHLGAALGMGYVPAEPGDDARAPPDARWEIEVAGARFAATASLRPFYDPASLRPKA